MEIKLLQDLLIIAGLAIFVLIVCHRVRLPTVVGLLITGLLVGPHGMSVVGAVHEVEVMAEIGVILLLFSITISAKQCVSFSTFRFWCRGGQVTR